MELYITNTTRQRLLFQVRWHGDHTGKVWERPIPSGGQILVTERDIGADPKDRWKQVEEHLHRMGARDAAELHQSGIEDYRGVAYRWDGLIEESEIQQAHEIVLDNASRISAEEMMKAAAGAHVAINGKDGGVKTSTVEVIEDTGFGRSPSAENIKFKVEVDPQNGEKIGKMKRHA